MDSLTDKKKTIIEANNKSFAYYNELDWISEVSAGSPQDIESEGFTGDSNPLPYWMQEAGFDSIVSNLWETEYTDRT